MHGDSSPPGNHAPAVDVILGNRAAWWDGLGRKSLLLERPFHDLSAGYDEIDRIASDFIGEHSLVEVLQED